MIGKWALLDIETSGVDPAQDKVIDLGFVVYDEGKLLKEFSFRLQTDQALEPIIIALTGLSLPCLASEGLSWDQIKPELEVLNECIIIAHNASFEESFLKRIFDELGIKPKLTDKNEYFHDSLDIFPFMLPYFPRLGLESINQIFQLWGKEKHQGLPDSTDLADALIFAHNETSVEDRKAISEKENLSSWWRLWIQYPLDKIQIKKKLNISIDLPKTIGTWGQVDLLNYASHFQDEQHKWLALKIIQMLGRGITGIVAPVRPSAFDLNIVLDVCENYIKHFKTKKIVICSSYFSPDEIIWFDKQINALSIDTLSCDIFNQHSLQFSDLLSTDEQAWSKDLMQFYHQKKSQYGVASRVPDLWCRKEPMVDVLWKSCRFMAKKQLKKMILDEKLNSILMIQPGDLDVLNDSTDTMTLFWHAKQLEWSTEFNVHKIKYYDFEHIIIACNILEKIDESNAPTIKDAKKLLEEFNSVIIQYIQNLQGTDNKRIFWDVDFSDLSRKYLSTWKTQVQNFLARRQNLKLYQTDLLDALWSQLDMLLEQLLHACSTHSFGLSWRSNSDKMFWELWNWNIEKLKFPGTKIFIDYEFDDESKEYWNDIFSLNNIEKNKRFDKIQVNEDLLVKKSFSLVIWEDLQALKLVDQVKDLASRGRVLFCSQDLALSTTIYSALIKEKSLRVNTWSDVMRDQVEPAPQVVFCWEKDYRLGPIAKHIWLNFDFLVIDRVPDLSWFAWAQAAWKDRAKNFSSSAFEAYWSRRAGLLRERYWPLARLCCAKEVIVFDSRKNKWKGDSWKILKSHINI